MNGKLPAVVKAMILASLSACALLAACGSGGSAKAPTAVDADTLLRGIYPELNEAYITIVDEAPDEEPMLSLEEVSELLHDDGARVQRGALVRMRPAATGVTYAFVPQDQWPQVLAWALEVDLTSYDGEGIFAPESSMAVVFLGANDGSFVSMYER